MEELAAYGNLDDLTPANVDSGHYAAWKRNFLAECAER